MSHEDDFTELEEKLRASRPKTTPMTAAFRHQLRRQLQGESTMKSRGWQVGRLANGLIVILLLIGLPFLFNMILSSQNKTQVVQGTAVTPTVPVTNTPALDETAHNLAPQLTVESTLLPTALPPKPMTTTARIQSMSQPQPITADDFPSLDEYANPPSPEEWEHRLEWQNRVIAGSYAVDFEIEYTLVDHPKAILYLKPEIESEGLGSFPQEISEGTGRVYMSMTLAKTLFNDDGSLRDGAVELRINVFDEINETYKNIYPGNLVLPGSERFRNPMYPERIVPGTATTMAKVLHITEPYQEDTNDNTWSIFFYIQHTLVDYKEGRLLTTLSTETDQQIMSSTSPISSGTFVSPGESWPFPAEGVNEDDPFATKFSLSLEVQGYDETTDTYITLYSSHTEYPAADASELEIIAEPTITGAVSSPIDSTTPLVVTNEMSPAAPVMIQIATGAFEIVSARLQNEVRGNVAGPNEKILIIVLTQPGNEQFDINHFSPGDLGDKAHYIEVEGMPYACPMEGWLEEEEFVIGCLVPDDVEAYTMHWTDNPPITISR